MALQDRIRTFREGFVGGIGWAFGVTLGFIIISALLWFLANRLGGIPYLGEKIQDLVRATSESNVPGSPQIPNSI